MAIKPVSGEVKSQDINDNLSYLDSKVDQIKTGPLGVLNSEAELKQKYPNGANGFFVINGDMWIWDGSKWNNGGVYQALGIADGSVTTSKRTTLGELATISTDGTIDINTSKKTIKVSSNGNIVYRNRYFPENLKNKEISIGETDSSFVYVDVNTGYIYYSGVTAIPENSVFLGYCQWKTKTFHFNFPFTVDGYEYRVGKREEAGSLSYIVANEPLILDFEKKTLTFPNNTSLGINSFNITKALPEARGQVLDLNINSGGQGYVVLNEQTGKFEFKILSSNSEIERNVISIGYIFCSSKIKFLNAAVSIEGKEQDKRYDGKVLTCLGDSITWGDVDGAGNGGFDYSWVSYMQDLCGFKEVENLGIKGTRITSTGSGGSFVERSVHIKSQDVVVIFGGVNDFHHHMPLGAYLSTDEKTFYGALNIMFHRIITNNPNSKILMITPMKTTKFVSTFDSSFNLNKNNAGYTQLDYVNAIKQIANIYSVTVLDLYEQAPFTPIIESQRNVFMPDGLHPSEIGYKELAYTISAKMNVL